MKVLVIVDRYLPDISGTAIRTSRLVEPVVRAGNDVHVVTLNVSTSTELSTNMRHSTEETINDVHVHRYSSVFQLVANLPFLHRRVGFDIVHARGTRLASYALLALVGQRVPVVLELNYLFPQRTFVRQFLWELTMKRVRRIIVLSQAANDWLYNTVRVAPNLIDVIVNGIDGNYFHPQPRQDVREKLGISSDSFVVGYLGTFWDWQGVFEIVESSVSVLQRDSRVRYLMVGDGPDFQATKQLAIQRGVDKAFIFPGSVPQDRVPQYLAAMDVFLLPRPKRLLTELAIPLKLPEAMAMELPVVVTDLPALTEVVSDNVNGLVVSLDSESVAHATLKLVRDGDLRNRLGKSARVTVLEQFSWDRAVQRLLDTYESAIGRRV